MRNPLTSQLLAFTSFIILISSCSSWIESTRKAITGDEAPREGAKAQETRWVPKAQYESLQTKYRDLNRRYLDLKDGTTNSGQASTSVNAETVDVFADGGMAQQASAATAGAMVATSSNLDLSENGFSEQKNLFNQGREAMVKGQLDQARAIFMQLSNSQVQSMRAESKFYLGMIYFERKNFDLALQVFEDMMNQEAASSKVLSALKMAVLCSDELGQPQKKARYQSILTDLFEIRS